MDIYGELFSFFTGNDQYTAVLLEVIPNTPFFP